MDEMNLVESYTYTHIYRIVMSVLASSMVWKLQIKVRFAGEIAPSLLLKSLEDGDGISPTQQSLYYMHLKCREIQFEVSK